MNWFSIDSNNPLFQLASPAKWKPHIIVASILSFLFIIFGQGIGFFIVTLIERFLSIESTIWKKTIIDFLEISLYFLPSIFIVMLWVKYLEKRPFQSIGFAFENTFKKINYGFGFGILMISLTVIILFSTNLLDWESTKDNLQGSKMILPTVLILFAYLIQGSTEEIVFRGWLMPIIGIKYSPWVGIIVSSILFALLHGANDNITFLSILNLFLFGIFIALFAIRQGSIWGVCAWHAIWNWMQGNFYGLEVSGNSDSPTLLNFKEIGPDWITGGNFGPEGGIIVTSILLLGSFLLLKLKQNKHESLH